MGYLHGYADAGYGYTNSLALVDSYKSVTNKSASTPDTATVSAAVGDMLFAIVVCDDDANASSIGFTAITGGTGLSWTRWAGYQSTDATADDNLSTATFVATATQALTDATITFTPSNTAEAKAFVVLRFTSGGSARSVFAQALNSGSSTTPSVSTQPTGYYHNGNDLIIGYVGIEGPDGDGVTPDADTTAGTWSTLIQHGTTGGTADTNVALRIQWKIHQGITVQQVYDPTLGTSRDWRATLLLVDDPTVASDPQSIYNVGWEEGAFDGTYDDYYLRFGDVAATASPSTIATTSTVGAPTTQVGATFTPATIVTTSGVGGPTLAVGATSTPTTVATVTTVGSPSVQTGSTSTPVTIATTSTVGGPTLVAGATPSPTVIVTTSTVPSVGVQTGSSTTPATVATTSVVGSPTVAVSAVSTPSTIATVTAVGAPTVIVAGDATVSATSIATVSAVGSPDVQTGSQVSATAIATTSSVGGPTLQAGAVPTPSTIATTSTVGAPTLAVGATVTTTTVATTSTVGSPTVAVDSQVAVSTISTISELGVVVISSAPSLVAVLGTTSNTTSQAATTVTVGSNTTVGDFAIARVAVDNAGTAGAAPGLTVTDDRGNSWTVLGPATQDPGAANEGTACYLTYARMVTALQNGDVITFTWGSGAPTAKAIVVEEWGGIFQIDPIDVSPQTANGASTSPSLSVSPSIADNLVYAVLATEGPTADTYTEDADTTNGAWVSLQRVGTG